MAPLLRILHRTEYLYDRPVAFGPHRLMLRPRDGHDLRVEDAFLEIAPVARLRWYFDTFGNSIAEATFNTQSDRLVIESELLIRRYPTDLHAGHADAPVVAYPFVYCDDDAFDLAAYCRLQNAGDASALDAWLGHLLITRHHDGNVLLHELADAVHLAITYSPRDELGTQSAGQTLTTRVGTCRDLAFLFIEAARRLGFAARFVTGYLDEYSTADERLVGGGASHAWADVFVPGSGWIEFDPTNRIVGGAALVRVATTRSPSQASPISGSFRGPGAAYLGMSVSVDVAER